MNLLYTITAYPPSIGGAQLHAHRLAQQMQLRGNGVQVVTQWDETRTDWLKGTTLDAPAAARDYVHEGVPVLRMGIPAEARRRLRGWVYAYYPLQRWALPRIASVLEAELAPCCPSADLVHNVRIGREGLSYASLGLARRRGIPFVFTPVHHPRWSTWLHRHYHRLYRAADLVVALTEVERRELAQLGVDERRVVVTGIGPILADAADGGRFRGGHRLGDQPVVLFLGQQYAYKGVAAVLSAARLVWAQFPEARFVFVGPRTEFSRRLFEKVSDSRVLELGSVNLQEKTDALAACDLLCVPSTQESFGGVYTEAWSLGKPVIGGDIPAVRAVIADGEDGFVVAQSPPAIADRVIRLLGDPSLRERCGRRGREKVLARYSWPVLAEQTERAYQRVLAGRL